MRQVFLNVVKRVSKPNCLILIFLFLFSGPIFSEPSNQTNTYMVVDSFGKHFFTKPPEKIVVTDWTLLEQLLALGVVPIGAPELERYKQYSPFKTLPESIQDIGSIQSPSLNKISSLNPDLIILGTDQKNLARPLSRIAKVLYYQNFSPRFNNNGLTAQKRLKQLSDVFKKQTKAEEVNVEFNNAVANYKIKLKKHFSPDTLSVMVVRVFPNNKIIAYSRHSIIGWIIENLGLKNNLNFKKNKFGEQVISKEFINKSTIDFLLCYGECSRQMLIDDKLNTKVINLSEYWPYGGVATMQAITMDISNKLLETTAPILESD